MALQPGESVFLFGSRAKARLRLIIATDATAEDAIPETGVYVDITPDQGRHILVKLAEALDEIDPKASS